MKKIHLLVLLCLSSLWNLYGQQSNPEKENANIPKIFPPSPSAYQLGNYGNLNIGEFTGTFQETINLMSYDIGNIKLPISLNYSSNGIKVDDYNSAVGLGWGLNAGGVVSVISRGINDFKKPIDWTSTTAPTDPKTGLPAFKYRFIMDATTDDFFNTERDLYRLNINGVLSTQFVVDGNRILEAKQSDIKIIRNSNSFIVKDSQGTKYTFDLIESTTTRSIGGGWSMPNHDAFSAFFLTKIEDTNGNIVIISYEAENSVYTLGQSQNFEFPFDFSEAQSGCSKYAYRGLSQIIETKTNSSSYRIKQISNNRNNTLISFDYTNLINGGENRNNYLKSIKYTNYSTEIEKIEFNYSTTSNNRVFLNNLTYKDLTKKYSFTYNNPTLLPRRLSLSQDYWGYYNGATNSSLVPEVENFEYLQYIKANRNIDTIKSKYGLLTEIKYPTKGYSKIKYESNDYYGEKIVKPNEVYELITLNTNISNNKNYNFSSTLNQVLKLNLEVLYDTESSNCMDGDDTNRQRMQVSIFNITTNTYIHLSTSQNLSIPGQNTSITVTRTNYGYFYTALKKNNEYRLEIRQLSPFCSKGKVILNYLKGSTVESFDNIITGGNRVKSIQHFSGDNTNMIRYYYANKTDISKSSGEIGYNPYFMKTITNLSYCPPPGSTGGEIGWPGSYTDYKAYNISSNSIISLFGNEGNGSQYRYITKSFGGNNFENGGETKEFIINRDAVAGHYFGTDSHESQYSNTGWNNGIEKQSILFDSSSKSLKEIINEYKYNDDKKIDVNNIIVRSNGSISSPITTYLYHCATADINNNTYGYNPCVKAGNNFPYYTQSQMDIFYNAYQYKSYSHNFNLAKTITKEYLLGGTITTETDYNYDSSKHLQLTKQTATNSKGETLTTEYQYPSDLTSGYEQSPIMQEMVNRNMIATPVITKSKNESTVLSEQRMLFNYYPGTNGNLILPEFVYAKKGENTTVSDRKITYNSYDTQGNLTQYTLENGIPVSIIWGYNGQYPILKVEGVPLKDIPLWLIDYLISPSNVVDNTELATRLNYQRNEPYFKDVMVTGYVYQPLVGVTQIIQPNGQTEYYKYDAANRLEEIRNDKKEVLKTFEYNYKQP